MNRIITLSTVLLALSLSINWILDESAAPQEDTARNDPDLYMLNASIRQFDESGSLQHILTAGRFTHFPLTDLTTLQSPSIQLASLEDDQWEITAQEGRLLPASRYREQIVELWDNVLASRVESNRFISIQTSSLTVYPEREYLETDQRVFIDSQSGRTTAAGMKAFLDTNKFMFFSDNTSRVTTIFLPE
ncbi:MAG: LPS export ABC transporter periplasmic protein LptC [Proteobacteria bacterium]|jgi:LPS export ABC transporter protein LptC|nr:LPS export ABC transporter periplasmic protein LptC [Pseudomonadota bacterium]